MTRRSSFNRFWEDIIRAGILTAIAGFIVFIGISGCGYYGNKKDYSQESFRYKQVLFLSAAGKTIGLNELDAYDIKTDNRRHLKPSMPNCLKQRKIENSLKRNL